MGNRFVINAFKVIAFAIIFTVVWNMAFYLLKVYSLDRKMENILTSMTLDVSRHNLMKDETYNMYRGMLTKIQTDMNGNDTHFIQGFNLNYGHNSRYSVAGGAGSTESVSGLTYGKDLSRPRNYGDVQVIELQVGIRPLTFFYDASSTRAMDDISWEDDTGVIMLSYIDFAPCLRYVNVTS